MSLNRKQKEIKLAMLEEKSCRLASKDVLSFTKKTFDIFKSSQFHDTYYKLLDLFSKGIIKKLMITIPPQHGKSEGSTKRLPSCMLGNNPDLKIAIASYNTPFARKFNRSIQRIIDTKTYARIFPNTKINGKAVVTVQSWLRNADEFEIVEKRGNLKAIGRGGSLTGNPVDILLIDDLYKDFEEGNSPVVLDSVWNWYTTVADTRLHNDSQQIIVFTRWNENDLVGKIEEKEDVITLDCFLDHYDPNTWYKINFEAIKDSPPTELDPRKMGEPLWPARHSLQKLEASKKLEPDNFQCLYQGNPQPKEGYLYKSFRNYDYIPESVRRRESYTDTADTGKDYLCSIIYSYDPSSRNDIYVEDVYYTPEAMEITEPETAKRLESKKTQKAYIESNNGGRGFGRNVKKLCKRAMEIDSFHQSGNKESRIYSNSASVQQCLIFPKDWSSRWPDFYIAMTRYKKMFKANKFDDGPDCCTGIIEKVIDRKSSILDAL